MLLGANQTKRLLSHSPPRDLVQKGRRCVGENDKAAGLAIVARLASSHTQYRAQYPQCDLSLFSFLFSSFGEGEIFKTLFYLG